MPTSPLASPTGAEKMKGTRTFMVTWKTWEIVAIIVGVALLAILLVSGPILLPLLLLPWYMFAGIGVAIAIPTFLFITWKVLHNVQVKTEQRQSLIPYNPTHKYVLEVSPEIRTAIGKLYLPDYDSLPEGAKKICDHCGVFDTTSMRECILSTLKKPGFQVAEPDCFAISHIIRWQANDPELIVEMLYQFFTRGNFVYKVDAGDLVTMSPFLKKGDGSPFDLLVGSLGVLFEEKSKQSSTPSLRAAYFFSLIEEIGKKIDATPDMASVLKKYLEQNGGKRLKEIVCSKFAELKCFFEQRAPGFYSLNIPLATLLKRCGMPSWLRKFIIAYLGKQPTCFPWGKDVLLGGNYGQVTSRMFSKEARTDLLPNDGNNPRILLEKMLELKRNDSILAGQLYPAGLTFSRKAGDSPENHEANAIIPKINSFDDIKDGQFIPLIWTNWCPDSQFGVIRHGNEYEWVNARGEHINMLRLSLYDPQNNRFTPASTDDSNP